MARKSTQRQTIDKLLAKYEPEIRKVFLESIEKIKSRVVLKKLIAELEINNINGAIAVLDIDFTDFAQLDNILSQTYNAGGVELADYLPALFDADGARVVIRFNARNIRAEQWLKDRSSNLITNIVNDQKISIRNVLTEGLAKGQNPRTIALDIVGRVEKGKREGGLIGLTTQQARYVADAREELLNGRNEYFIRLRRDKRFDSTIRTAFKEGRQLDNATVDKITGRYSSSLLKLRGDTIARTEALASLNSAKDEAFQQGLEKTSYSQQDVSKVWRSASDKRVRDSHVSLNGQTVYGLNAAFVSSTGAHLKFPHDSSLGAGAEDIINCRCIVQYKIDFAKNL